MIRTAHMIKPTKKNLLSASIISGILICMTVLFFFLTGKDVIYIAVVGPMTGESKENGEEMVSGIKLCLDGINSSGGLDGKKIELLVFDDKNDEDLAGQKAHEIVEDDKAMLVLGHDYSACSLAAGKIYRNYGVPSITASTADSVVKENEWCFRIIPGNSVQGAFIANYIHKVLGEDSVTIIHEETLYALDLVNSFAKEALKIGLNIKGKWRFDLSSKDVDNTLENIALQLRSGDSSGMIFIAAHEPEGGKLVTSLKYSGGNFTIIGPDTFGSEAFLDALKKYPLERAIPGYYSDGIYAVSPFILDIANKKAQVFQKKFNKKYDEEPSWFAASYYDAMLVAIQAIQRAGITGKQEHIQDDRIRIRNYLSMPRGRAQAIEGVTGYIHFDKTGDITRPFAAGIYKHQKLVSTLSQYQSISNVREVDNILKETLEGRVIFINGTPMKKTRIAYTGIDINEVSNVDLKDSVYTLDFYIWFRYHEGLDVADIEFLNSVEPLELGDPIIEEKTSGIITKAYRVRAAFKNDFLFHDYPFDHQTLRISLRHRTETRDKLIYVTDVLGMPHMAEKGGDQAHNFSVKGWRIDDVLFFSDVKVNRSTLGLPRLYRAHNTIQYSQFNASIQIKRDVPIALFQELFALAIMIITCYVVYFIPAHEFGSRISIGMSTLLTSAFLHLTLSSELSVGYLVAVEYVYYTTYVLASISILITLFVFELNEHGKAQEKLIDLLDLGGKIIHPCALIALVNYYVFTYAG